MLASQMDGRMGFPGTRKDPDPGQLYHRDLGSMLGTECRRLVLVGGSWWRCCVTGLHHPVTDLLALLLSRIVRYDLRA